MYEEKEKGRGKKSKERKKKCIELTWFGLKLPKSIDKMTWLKATYYWM